MSVTFARGGAKASAKGSKPGIVSTVVNAIAGTGGCGTGTVGGKKGFQPGNKCAQGANRNPAVAAARSAHTRARGAVSKHLKAARKAGTSLSKEGQAAVRTAARAHRELAKARETHAASKREARNASRREARAASKATGSAVKPPAVPKKPAAKAGDAKAQAAKALREARAAALKARVESSAKESGAIKVSRAVQHLHDLKTGVKAGAFDRAAAHGHLDRIARGVTKNELFKAAKEAGIEHKAKTKKDLVEHLKGHVVGDKAGTEKPKPPEKPQPARPRPEKIGTPQDRSQRATALRAARKAVKSKTARSDLALKARHDRLSRRDMHEDYKILKAASEQHAAKVADHVAASRGEIAAAHAAQGAGVLTGLTIAEKLAGHKAGDVAARRVAEVGAIHEESVAPLLDRKKHYSAAVLETAQRLRVAEYHHGLQPRKFHKAFTEAVHESRRASEGLERIRKHVEAGRDRVTAHVHDILAAPSPSQIREIRLPVPEAEAAARRGPIPDPVHQSARAGSDFVSRVFHDPAGRGLEVHFDQHSEGPNGRAFHSQEVVRTGAGHRAASYIQLGDHAGHRGRSIAVHELGHALEHQHPAIGRAARDFLDYRVGDEPLVKIKDVHGPSSAYDDHELGRSDKFADAFGTQAHYVGKYYGGTTTEITSMGLQLLHDNPVHLARADPEYFKFIHAVTSGGIR